MAGGAAAVVLVVVEGVMVMVMVMACHPEPYSSNFHPKACFIEST